MMGHIAMFPMQVPHAMPFSSAKPDSSIQSPIHTFEDALRFLNGLDVSAMKLGLDRIRTLMDTLGNPQDSLPMVHIAGTNGKGSVTAMLSSVLKSAGLRVGSFTSPHLIHVRERIVINGNPILQDDFQYEIASLQAHLEALGLPREEWPTYFEFINVVAYQYFKRKQVDITVFETGLGGRLDSTNIVKHPNLTVITTIGMDHMQHLGDTLSKIAAEKAGILKQGVPLVLGPAIPQDAMDTILEQAELNDVPVKIAQADMLQVLPQESNPVTGLCVSQSDTGRQYRLSLLGLYQKNNLAVVLECIQVLRHQGFVIEESAIQEGLAHTYWPVRFQYFEKQHLILDGSHNEDGFQSLQECMRFYFQDQPMVWLLSLRGNRNPEYLTRLIQQFGKPLGVVVTQSNPLHLYHPATQLAESIRPQLPPGCPVEIAETPTVALARLKALQQQLPGQKPLGVITGSLYTAGEILSCLNRGE